MKVIIYANLDGSVDVTYPAYNNVARPVGDTDDALLARCLTRVPVNAANVQIIEHTDLPTNHTKRHAWRLDGQKKIVIDNQVPAPPKSDIEILKEEVSALKNKSP